MPKLALPFALISAEVASLSMDRGQITKGRFERMSFGNVRGAVSVEAAVERTIRVEGR